MEERGTALAAHRLNHMVRLLSTWGLVFLLALFVGGNAGHHAAMAKSTPYTPPEQHATLENHHQSAKQGICYSTECAHDDKSCCVMGQCLIGIAPIGMAAIPPQPRVVVVPKYGRARDEAVPRQPFRPPA